MTTRARLLKAALCVLTLFCAGSRAQTAPPANTTLLPKEQPGAVSADPVANELALLRKSLQTLNARLREITEKVFSPDAVNTSPLAAPGGKQSPLAQSLDILSRAEQRAEGMRRQLLEMTEKETAYRTRMMQLDDDMRPESIDRSLTGIGTTRTPDLRDLRRRQLDNERRGVEILLGQASTNRARLEDDVKQADALVTRIRQRLLPLIEKEIDKLNPNP
jgi:hypothetical protein